jgi:hypothetical protein
MRARPAGMPLALAITLALVAKIVILTLLYKTFFSAPQAKHMRMPSAQVEQHLLGKPVPVPAPVSKAQP